MLYHLAQAWNIGDRYKAVKARGDFIPGAVTLFTL